MASSSMVFLGFVFSVGQLAVGEFTTQCYNVNNYQYCWSTNGTLMTWQGASEACRARNSTLLSVTSSRMQSVLRDFRSNVSSMYSNYNNSGMWINVATGVIENFHWIEGTTGNVNIGGQQLGDTRRFAVITLDPSDNITVIYRAYPWNDLSHFICMLTESGVDCTSGFRKSSKCYLKYNETVTWFTAGNRCLSMGGSLATFNDLSTPSGDSNLTSWLNITGTTKYWIGLVKRWYIIQLPGRNSTDVQYTNWESGSPHGPDSVARCVLLTNTSQWSDSFNCTDSKHFACQTITSIPTSTTTSTTTTTTATPPPTTTSSALRSVVNVFSIAPTSTEQPLTSQPSLSSTTSTNNVKSAGLEATTSVIPLAVGIGVGVGVPVFIAIIVIVVILCRRHKNRDEDSDAKITAVKKRVSRKWSKPKHINAYESSPNCDFENCSSPPSTKSHAEDPVYAAVVKNSTGSNETDDAERSTKPEVHDSVIYAQLVPAS